MTHLLRRSYRSGRKRARRAASHLVLAGYRARNRFSRAPVTGSAPALVSLTTYGDRIAAVASTIESIGRGRARPARLVLWLDESERTVPLPANLRRLQRRGLTVDYCPDLGPHKKYHPSLGQAAELAVPLVTADDDVFYPHWWLERLLAAHRRAPDAVHCHWANVVTVGADGRITPYTSWPRCRSTAPSPAHFSVGVSGALYPPAMVRALAARGTGFLDVSPRADDIWLHWVALQEGIPVGQVGRVPHHFMLVPGTQTTTLLAENLGGGGNDDRIAALYSAEDVARIGAAATTAG